ncbi:TIGR03620 family F420-dependent LLM class oxidoreductase, partial [Actinoallomurus purpureus]|uniref:TIGR03620 family F420-dependent LLM class oxidoreductase n=1 Tax=Actinoallomurus purpureus TaxID=478114 RepID=UPI002092239E
AEGLTADPGALTRLARVRAAVEFERGDPRRAARILVEQVAGDHRAPAMLRMGASYAWLSGDRESVRAAAERSAGAGRRDPLLQGLAHLVDDDFARGVPLLREVLDGALGVPGDGHRASASDGGMTEDPGETVEAIHSGLILGDDDAAIRLATAEVARCRQRGLVGELAGALQRLAQAQVAAGLFRDGEANVAEAITIARDTGRPQRVGRLQIVLARVAAIQGDEERCGALTGDPPGRDLPGAESAAADCALGLLDLGLGRYDDALDRLDAARRGPGGSLDLGTFGVYTFDFEDQPAARMRESIQELEEQGWRAFWFPELLGREALTHAGYLLSCTERMHIINGIAQIWSRQAWSAYGAALLLADAYPDRHVLGLGFGGEQRPGVKPLAAMTEYLDAMDAVESPNPRPRAPMRRILAAYGPKMLELARDRAAGAQTYHVTVAHTAQAREVLGREAFLGVEHAVLLESDPGKARAIAREHLRPYLTSPYNIAKFRRLGYSEEEIAGGSDRIVDDLVFWGDVDAIVGRLHGHVEAGADHVAVQVIGIEPGRSAMPHWRLLGDALLSR